MSQRYQTEYREVPPTPQLAASPVLDPKRRYQLELQQQMREQAEQKRRRREEEKSPPKEQFFNFGSPGAGAPHRDQYGRIVAVRPPKYNENDPRFMDPSRFYDNLAVAEDGTYVRGVKVSQSVPNLGAGFTPATSYGSPPPPPGSYYPAQYPPFQPSAAPAYPQDSPAPGPMGYNQASGNIFAPTARASQPVAPFYPQPAAGVQPRRPSVAPPFDTPMQAEYEGQMKARSKKELGQALIEQMEEKRRRQEEEHRQRLLEERMEEARLERERLKMQEEYLLEADKKRKQYEDVQRANEQNIIIATQHRKPKRERTPVDMAPGEPPRSPPHAPPDYAEPTRQISKDITVDFSKEISQRVENEVYKIRRDLSEQQTDLRESVLQLKDEALHANEERYAAYRELERLKDEMRARAAEEDMRQRELFNAIVRNPLPMSYDSKFSEGISNAITRAKAPEAVRSLASDSKFLPVAHGADPLDINFRAIKPDERHELMKHKLMLDDLFPPRLALKTKEESLERADDTIQTEAINIKNDRLMHKLTKLEKARNARGTRPLDEFIGELLEKAPNPRTHRRPSRPPALQTPLSTGRPALSRASNTSSVPSLASRGSNALKSPLLYESKADFYRPLLSRKDSEARSPIAQTGKYSLAR